MCLCGKRFNYTTRHDTTSHPTTTSITNSRGQSSLTGQLTPSQSITELEGGIFASAYTPSDRMKWDLMTSADFYTTDRS